MPDAQLNGLSGFSRLLLSDTKTINFGMRDFTRELTSPHLTGPQQATLTLEIDGPQYRNSYAIRNQPEGRQFMHSLLQYMDSVAFSPEHELDPGLLGTLLPE